jgi:pyruvate formate lyase activating enzyme
MKGGIAQAAAGGVTRREFLVAAGSAAACAALRSRAQAGEPEPPPVEAEFYDRLPGGAVRCRLCPFECTVPDGGRGRCRVRANRGGRYYTLVHGRPVARNVDPVEKKPFFHVLPGSRSYSLATVGCNIECRFCQNWNISQARPEDVPAPHVSPAEIAEAARRASAATMAFTYSEPIVFYEYMRDCAREGRRAGIASLMVSNGMIREEPLRRLAPDLAAVKIDLKAFTQKFYEEVCGGQLQPVLDTLKRLRALGVWTEIVVLLIPTLNDAPEETRRLAAWVARELGPDVPLHFTRFHPDYRLKNLPPTPPETLLRARADAMAEGCRFVYAGNLPGNEGEHTYCPGCRKPLIRRYHFTILSNTLRDGRCPDCAAPVPGLWSLPQAAPPPAAPPSGTPIPPS